MQTKVCNKCKAVKEFSEFYSNRRTSDGLQSTCKECKKLYSHSPQYVETRRIYNEKNRGKQRSYAANYRKIHKPKHNRQNLKEQARVLLERMVSQGKITKPGACEQCNKTLPKQLIHGHHEDYSMPLVVTWVCSECHGKYHQTMQYDMAAT